MGRRRLPDYEVRDVTHALAPAVAHRDPDGLVVVEVDEALQGQARDDAIAAALEPFRQGWRAATPVPLVVAAWDAGTRIVQEYPRAAAAAAGASAVAVLGAATLTFSGVPEGGERPAVIAASTVTQMVSVTPATPSMSSPRTSPSQSKTTASDRVTSPRRTAPPARPEPAGNGAPVRKPPATTREAALDPAPSRTTRRPVASSASARSSSATPTMQAAADDAPPPTRVSQPTSPRGENDPPTVDEPDRPTPAPQPQPEPEPDRGPLVDLEVGGPDCHLVDLEVGVGELLGAGVCL